MISDGRVDGRIDGRIDGRVGWLGLAAALALVSGCARPAGEGTSASVRRQVAPILEGVAATGYPEAVLVDLVGTGYCSGSLIAPSLVLTAGHCVVHGGSFQVTAPYASGQTATSEKSSALDYTDTGETVDGNEHDLGVVFLDQPIQLASYPSLASQPLPDGSSVRNIGRIDNGSLSTTALYLGAAVQVSDASNMGFPYEYETNDIIEPGDSGGPVVVPDSHTIVAVNSGAGGGTQLLARVDLVYSWLQDQIAQSQGQSGASAASSSSSSGGGSSSSSGGGGCGHSECQAGDPLDSGCSACAGNVCGSDSYCCSTAWDATCVQEAGQSCGC